MIPLFTTCGFYTTFIYRCVEVKKCCKEIAEIVVLWSLMSDCRLGYILADTLSRHSNLKCITAVAVLPGGIYWQAPEEFTNTLVWKVASNLSSALRRKTNRQISVLVKFMLWCVFMMRVTIIPSMHCTNTYPGRIECNYKWIIIDL